MRPLIRVGCFAFGTALTAIVTSCAQQGQPPGGPPDVLPPRLLRVRPDSNARNVHGGNITFDFDEVIREQPQGAQSLADIILVSPSHGRPSVGWHRSAITVSPRGGLKPNTTYTVRLLGGVTDLSNNVDSAGKFIVFSTGPDISTGVIQGRVFDWAAARVAPRAFVEAIRLPDSARYSVEADSLGAFRLTNLPPGRFLVDAVIDQNHNRERDLRELFDTTTVTLQDSLRREMLAILRDSVGPGIANVEVHDSMTIRVTFDRALDTAFVLTPAEFLLKSADSTLRPILSVISDREAAKRAADSARVRAIKDSVRQAAQEDSVRRADSAKAGAQPARPTGRRPGAAVTPGAPATDTTKAKLIQPTAQIPSLAVVIGMQNPLPAGTTFRLRAIGMRSVTGAERTSDRVFLTPKAKPPPDSGKVKKPGGGAH